MNQLALETNVVRRFPTPLMVIIAVVNMTEGALAVALGIIFIPGMLTSLQAAERLRRSGRADGDDIMTLLLVLPPVIIATGALAFASGIGILFLRAWGRLLAMVYAAACFGCATVALFMPDVATLGEDAPVDLRAHVAGCIVAMAVSAFVIYMFSTPRWVALFFPSGHARSGPAPVAHSG